MYNITKDADRRRQTEINTFLLHNSIVIRIIKHVTTRQRNQTWQIWF